MSRKKQMTLAEFWICEGREHNDFEQFMVNATLYKIRRVASVALRGGLFCTKPQIR